MNADDGTAFEDDPDYPPPVDAPETVGDLVARDRRTAGPALRAEAADRTLSYRDFVTTSYKAGNVLRYLGVRAGETVLVVPQALPEPALAFYGAAQLGAVTRFAETVDGGETAAGDDGDGTPRVVVAPADREREFDLPPGHHLLVYGDRPSDPSTTHWETEVWSENPAIHPASVDGDDPLLRADGRTLTHTEALSAAAVAVEYSSTSPPSRVREDAVEHGSTSPRSQARGDAVADAGLRPGDQAAVAGSLADPDVVAAGLLAPIAAGATIVFPDESADRG